MQLILQQLLPELLLELLLELLHPQLLQLHPELLPASFVLPADHVLPAADLLRAGHDLQLHSGDDLPGLHRVRPPVQHLLPADLLDALLPADLQLLELLPAELLPADLQSLELQPAFLLQLVQQRLVPQLLQLQLRWPLEALN
jgi:hypothetical protein